MQSKLSDLADTYQTLIIKIEKNAWKEKKSDQNANLLDLRIID